MKSKTEREIVETIDYLMKKYDASFKETIADPVDVIFESGLEFDDDKEYDEALEYILNLGL